MNTIEKNKIIAEFMNLNITKRNPTTVLYHRDWNWLMELVEKIEYLGYFIQIDNIGCVISQNNNDIFKINNRIRIEAVYNACVEFIKYYNKQNK